MTEPSADLELAQIRPLGTARLVVASGVGVACLLYATSCALTRSYGEAFFATPCFVGFVIGLSSQERPYRNTFLGILLALCLAVLTLYEGVICVLFSLPIVIPLALIGSFAGFTARRWWRERRQRQALGAGAVLLAVGWQAIAGATDDPIAHPLHSATSSIAIAAPPGTVFEELTEKPLTARGRWPWFIEIGLPIPRSLEVVRPGLGGLVRVQQSTGTAEGHISAWQPGRRLEYGIDEYRVVDPPLHITRLGRAPDYGLRAERVGDWLSIESIRFDLEPLPNGHTELTRTIVWRRHLAPGFYFGWLQQAVIERGQERLLDHLRVPLAGGTGSAPPFSVAAGVR